MTVDRSSAATWLMLIDMQRIFGEADSPWFASEFAAASAACVRLRASFGPHTALTRFIAPEKPVGIWSQYYDEWPFARAQASAHLYDVMPEFPIGDAVVISRSTFGKWDGEVRDLLRGVTEIVLAGVSTDCCVLSTALVAADDGIRVRVVADACAGASEVSHRRALDVMSLYAPHIEITTVDAVLAT